VSIATTKQNGNRTFALARTCVIVPVVYYAVSSLYMFVCNIVLCLCDFYFSLFLLAFALMFLNTVRCVL